MDTTSYDYEIYLYDASSRAINQLTDNTVYDYEPQINERGDVVWYASDARRDTGDISL